MLTVRDGSPLQLSLDQIKRMTWQELSRIWKVTSLPIALFPHCYNHPILSPNTGKLGMHIQPKLFSECKLHLQEYVNAIAMRLVTATNKFNGTSEQRLTVIIPAPACHC